MRKLGGIVLAIVWLAGCGGEGRLRSTDGLAVTGPDALDFGRVGLGATVTRTVEIRNGGRAHLSVGEVSLDGLGRDFEVKVSGGPILSEGETASIDVSFTPQEEAVLQRIMEVRTSDPQREVIVVPLTGIGVRPRILTSPTSLDFGKIELGVASTLPLVLENGFDIEVEVELSRDGDPQFSIAPSGAVAVPANSRTEIQVTFLPEHLGKADGLVRILPCPICDPVLVPATGVGIDQALLVEPPEVDFGYVPVERSAARSVQITNVSSHPVDIHSITPELGKPAFAFKGFSGTLQPDESIMVEITFSPTQVDLDEEWMLIDSTSERSPIIRVHLFGRGGGPQIQVTPAALTFGSVPVGARGQLDLIVTNAGTDPGAPPLRILDVRVEDPADAPFGPDRDLTADPVVLQAGEEDTIRIGYEPLQATVDDADDRATLVIASNDQMVPEVRIPMSGSAFAAPPCDGLELSPAALDFGSFPEGWGGVLSFRIFNPSSEFCIMRNLRIAAGSDPAFTTWPVQSFVIPPQQSFGWMVAFDPHAVGAGAGYHTGELELFVANAGGQRYAIPLVAGSLDGCLAADPNFIDFGTDQTGCGVRERAVRFTNMCPFDVTVGPVVLGTQSTPDEFELVGPPATPFRLGSGGSFAVDVRWNTEVRGINSVPLFVWDDTRDLPLTVPVIGELLQDGVIVDRFVQHRAGMADVLVVVDNSSSMVEEQPRLKSAAHILFDEGVRRGVDFRLAVTSTGVTDAPNGQFVCPG
ncbi:MAG TPA: choice-of-anchor D domain-containing protein, partial [Vulgatibacter sp.]|nr:choice-of-anchor D domain-containing protein [Vulgatibacter sp.]